MSNSSGSEYGGTLYDRGARTGSEPAGASGIFARRDGGREHSTQYYSDGYRLSRDTGQGGDRDVHWTNQGVVKGSPSRHNPPPHSTLKFMSLDLELEMLFFDIIFLYR